MPIEIAVPPALDRTTRGSMEIVAGEYLLRREVGMDVGDVAALLRALRER